ncbi:MAG: hydroxymethylbilane synthase [Deltaproteobacteria bacterium]|nr:hydroxymethylbilane synthase [Deltaproteobacteria bacterium]
MKIRIATRKSKLALTQTRWVAARIRDAAPEVEVEEVHVVTRGDVILDKPLAAIGGKGLFISEVEAIVSRGEADLAVHSLKDVPGDTPLAEGMAIVCVPKREDPRDVLLSATGASLADLGRGARVGTTSLRRMAQLRKSRPDLEFATLRGNVETRLGRLDEGRYDAIVLAAAGLKRLGLLEGRGYSVLDPETCLPAVGQGTLAIEARMDDERVRALLAPLEHAETRLRTEAERAMLIALQGSCQVPIAGHARISDDGMRLWLEGMVASIDGEQVLTATSESFLKSRDVDARRAEAAALGEEVAKNLIDKGARELMRQAEATMARQQQSN